MRPQPPGGAGPDGRSPVSAGRCHLPSGHASLPRGRQRSRRARGAEASSPAPASIGVGRSRQLPKFGLEGAVRSPNPGCFPSRFIPCDGAPPAPHKASALTPSVPSPPGTSQGPQTQPSSRGALQRGSLAPRDPSLLPFGRGFGQLGACTEPGTCRGRFAAGSEGERSPSPTRRLFTGI